MNPWWDLSRPAGNAEAARNGVDAGDAAYATFAVAKNANITIHLWTGTSPTPRSRGIEPRVLGGGANSLPNDISTMSGLFAVCAGAPDGEPNWICELRSRALELLGVRVER